MRFLSGALLLWLCTSAGVYGQNLPAPDARESKFSDTSRDPSLPSTQEKFRNLESPTAKGELSFALPPDASKAPTDRITISYLEKFPTGPVNGEKSSLPTRFEYRVLTAYLDLNCDLAKIELTGDGKRAAVQAITAARHKKLLQALKDAKSEDDKVEAAKKLEENYRAHYAIETAWREERIAELEKRIEEMRSQVKERATSEDKYVEAAMTLAKLHAQGISAEPPILVAPGAGQYGSDSQADQPPTLFVPAVGNYPSQPTFNPNPETSNVRY